MSRASTSASAISIVVPVLNEAALLGRFLRQLRARAPGAEVIVVDGGSTDGTQEIAAPLCDRLIRGGPGRAPQLNAGARAAQNNVLWFFARRFGSPIRLPCSDSVPGAGV